MRERTKTFTFLNYFLLMGKRKTFAFNFIVKRQNWHKTLLSRIKLTHCRFFTMLSRLSESFACLHGHCFVCFMVLSLNGVFFLYYINCYFTFLFSLWLNLGFTRRGWFSNCFCRLFVAFKFRSLFHLDILWSGLF